MNFAEKYNLTHLVYYAVLPTIEEAITSEKKLKNWHRDWKINFITEHNPDWRDLYDDIIS